MFSDRGIMMIGLEILNQSFSVCISDFNQFQWFLSEL